ncbi:hypothetical protein H3N56_02870 [Cetobacterium sp. 2A]|uniref:hypothetical protein n=1 Tax=Cetobacterium sp. 2A TaxID=2754723 RepID=UPI00163B96AA|nr:hypothetical protein [Cetobacterium sp. 2A]MBC2855436.1 hypothetical protein [Cetobacterium sp. 2A]
MGYYGYYGFTGILLFWAIIIAIQVLIVRWLFKINKIVDCLEKQIEVGNKTNEEIATLVKILEERYNTVEEHEESEVSVK